MVLSFYRKLEINRAVIFSLLNQVWSGLIAPITMLVIAKWFSAVEQGFYYTFNNVLALQVFVEMGLVGVIIQITSHEWAFLKRESNGVITGNLKALSRIGSLLKFSLKWYLVSGLFVSIGLGVAGFFFFSIKPNNEINWQWPWISLCLLAGMALVMSPVFSVIEGCNQVTSIYSFKFVQSVLYSLTIIVSIIFGCKLYALTLGALVRFICGLFFIVIKHFNFVKQIFKNSTLEHINWREEVWPFQWRIGVSWISGYFIFNFFTPIMFYYHGPTAAGQMGMTFSLVAVVEAFAYPWICSRIPLFGVLIARKQYNELDKLFRKLMHITLTLCTIIAFGIFIGVLFLEKYSLSLANRILPLIPVSLLLCQKLLNFSIGAMALYLRAHKNEPLMIPSLITAILVGISTWKLGANYGPTGAIWGFLIITVLYSFPTCYYTFRKSQLAWHK